ncbi:MAG: hypothetical protein HC780_23695 [Leptolyngbyaceae cyanobacterium CSU_1_3]|nr:hypothetical protein [Leptolyngbyaceae cyanobacterium CSU_1_3]
MDRQPQPGLMGCAQNGKGLGSARHIIGRRSRQLRPGVKHHPTVTNQWLPGTG